MIVHETVWKHLRPELYIRDKTGKIWRIRKERDGHFLITDRDGESKMLTPKPPETPVTVLVPSPEEAQRSVEEILGGELVAEKPKDQKEWIVHKFQTSGPGVLAAGRTHMKLLHGVMCDDVKSAAEIIEAHNEFHESPSFAHVPHVHA